MEQLKPSSHLLKHLIDSHENDDHEKVKFGMKDVKFTHSSFERQILESVVIQQERHHNLLNSRAKFNRCAIPRVTTKMGENLFKQWEAENEKEKEKDEKLEEKLREMRKERNKGRRGKPKQ